MAHPRKIALLLVAGSFALSATPAGANIQIGISDQNPNVFVNPYFKALNMRYARIVVPWNVATRRGYWRHYLTVWLDNAQAAGIEPHVAFGVEGLARRFLGKGPTPARYSKAVGAFRKRWPQVRVFSPWNEENHAFQVTAKHPKLAAQYYAILKKQCKDCKVLGADVLDDPRLGTWMQRFRSYLKRYSPTTPRLWGLHNYQDANHHRSFRTSWTYRLTKLVPGVIWSTEAGGLVGFKTIQGRVAYKYSLTRQRSAQKYLFALMADPRVRSRYKRVYIYNFYGSWTATRKTNRWDSGLIGLNGKPRPAYGDLKKIIARNGGSSTTRPAARGARR